MIEDIFLLKNCNNRIRMIRRMRFFISGVIIWSRKVPEPPHRVET